MIDHIASTFRRRRRALKLSQEALSVRSGVSREVISRFESRGKDVNLSTIIALAKALDCRLELTTEPVVDEIHYVDDWAALQARVAEQMSKRLQSIPSGESPRAGHLIDGRHIKVRSWGGL
jgi:transcriptional regulator with XRE-family HTH domain